MTDQTKKRRASTPRARSKQHANRVAAAKVFVAASERTGDPVPPSVLRLAREVREAG